MGNNDPDWKDTHLEVVSKTVRARVVGKHHKQRDTIKRWCSGYDGDVIDSAIDDLLAEGVLQRKRSNTVQLVSIQAGKDFIRENDEDGDYSWYL